MTALCFDDSGLHCAVGTSNGLVALFDLRSSQPMRVKDHMYGQKIVDIKFHVPLGTEGTCPFSRAISTSPWGLRNCTLHISVQLVYLLIHRFFILFLGYSMLREGKCRTDGSLKGGPPVDQSWACARLQYSPDPKQSAGGTEL